MARGTGLIGMCRWLETGSLSRMDPDVRQPNSGCRTRQERQGGSAIWPGRKDFGDRHCAGGLLCPRRIAAATDGALRCVRANGDGATYRFGPLFERRTAHRSAAFRRTPRGELHCHSDRPTLGPALRVRQGKCRTRTAHVGSSLRTQNPSFLWVAQRWRKWPRWSRRAASQAQLVAGSPAITAEARLSASTSSSRARITSRAPSARSAR